MNDISFASIKNQYLRHSTKLLIFGFALAALFLTSCNTEDDVDSKGYFINFKADGVLEEFTSEHSLSGYLLNDGSPYRLTVDANKPSAVIALAVFDKKAIEEDVYNGLVVKRSSTQYSVVGAEIGYQKNEANYASGRIESSDVSITITKITSNTVRGKFSGKLYGAAQAEIVITDGEFFVPLGNLPN